MSRRLADQILYGSLRDSVGVGDWSDAEPTAALRSKAERLIEAVAAGDRRQAVAILQANGHLASSYEAPLLNDLYRALAEHGAAGSYRHDDEAECEELSFRFQQQLRRRIDAGEDDKRLFELEPLELLYERERGIGPLVRDHLDELAANRHLYPLGSLDLRMLKRAPKPRGEATEQLFELLCGRIVEAAQGAVRVVYGRPAEDGWLSICDRYSPQVIRIKAGRRLAGGSRQAMLMHLWDPGEQTFTKTVCGIVPKRYQPRRLLRGSWSSPRTESKQCSRCARLASGRVLPDARSESLRRYQVLSDASERRLAALVRPQLEAMLADPVWSGEDLDDSRLITLANEMLADELPAIVVDDLLADHQPRMLRFFTESQRAGWIDSVLAIGGEEVTPEIEGEAELKLVAEIGRDRWIEIVTVALQGDHEQLGDLTAATIAEATAAFLGRS